MADSRENYLEILGVKGVNNHRYTGFFMKKDTSQNFIADASRYEGPTGSHRDGCPAVKIFLRISSYNFK